LDPDLLRAHGGIGTFSQPVPFASKSGTAAERESVPIYNAARISGFRAGANVRYILSKGFTPLAS
jgi:hypothetical protein